jgi:hypothetical protein
MYTDPCTIALSFMTYTVFCPALNEQEICHSQDHAIDVAYSMHDESGSYVWVEDYLGHTVIEYGEVPDGNVINHQTIPCD